MEAADVDKKSYFDLMEERSESPTTFAWAPDLRLLQYSAEEVIFEGRLLTRREGTEMMVEHEYILTVRSLIRRKVGIGQVGRGHRGLS